MRDPAMPRWWTAGWSAAVSCQVLRSVITFSSSVQVAENFQSLEVIPKLTPEIMEEIDEICQSKPEPLPTFR